MDNKQALINLTNKFYKDFFELADKSKDNLYTFNFTLPDIIAQSDYPRYNEQDNLLMGMSSFDTRIAINFFNTRLQGFVKLIEEKLSYKGEQDDYYIDNIVSVSTEVPDQEIEHIPGGGLKLVDVKVEEILTTFSVRNSRSGFSGHVKLYRRLKPVFKEHTDEIEERWMVTQVHFYVEDRIVMKIDYKPSFHEYDSDGFTVYKEEGEIIHFKYTADINSFYTTISCVGME